LIGADGGYVIQLKVAQNSFQHFPALSKTLILMSHIYNHSLSVDGTIKASKLFPIIGENVVIIFLTQKVTIVIDLIKTPRSTTGRMSWKF